MRVNHSEYSGAAKPPVRRTETGCPDKWKPQMRVYSRSFLSNP